MSQFSGGSESIKPFLDALIVAGTALVTFTFALKKNTDVNQDVIEQKFKEHQNLLREDSLLKKRNAELDELIAKEYNTFGAAPTELFEEQGKINTKRSGISSGKKDLQAEINAQVKEIENSKLIDKIAIGASIAAGVGTFISSSAQKNASVGQRSTLGVPTVGRFVRWGSFEWGWDRRTRRKQFWASGSDCRSDWWGRLRWYHKRV